MKIDAEVFKDIYGISVVCGNCSRPLQYISWKDYRVIEETVYEIKCPRCGYINKVVL